MNTELVAWLSILGAFSLYGVLSGIELGVAMMRLEPRLAPAKPARKVFNPRWEITNVLLAIGAAAMVVIFNEAALAVAREIWPVLVAGLLAVVIRAGLMSYLFLHKSAPGGRALNYLLAVVSMVVPLTLGSAGIYMVTGQPFWDGGVGATLFISMVVGLLALSFSFIYYVGGKRAPQGVVMMCRVLNVVLACLLALVLLAVLNGGGSHLFNLPYAYLAVVAAGIVLTQSIFIATNREWRMWWFLAALVLVAPFLMGLANYPYLIFPEVLLETTFEI